MKNPKVTVIIPCLNEEQFIRQLLEDVIAQDYPKESMEVIVADGLSLDGTRGIIREFCNSYPFVHLMDNEKRFVPSGLNKAIQESSGDVIIRMDAHASYPANYISRLVESLVQLNADNVGGVWVTIPSGNSPKARAIALASSSCFGIGNAHYRLGAAKIKQVDTVPFGCYHRSLFDRIGMFDETLLRNQDDEFNARLIRNGGRIFLIPDLKIRYFARSSITSMCRMFYQYGLFKPLVNLRVKQPATLRQFIPPLFVFYLLTAGMGFLISPKAGLLYGSFMLVYLILNLVVSLTISVRNGISGMFFYLPWIFFLIHLSYGYGYLTGILKFVLLCQKNTEIISSR